MKGTQPTPLSTETILQLGVPVEHAAQDDVGHHAGVADEEQRPADGQLGVLVLGLPGVGAEVGHGGEAGADVEVHGQVQVGADLPQRVPGPVGQVGAADVVGVRGDVDAAQVERGDPLGLGHGCVHVPGREHRHGEEAAARVGLHLGHGVVVDLHAQQAQLGVLHDVGDPLAAEADGVGEADLGVDPRVVHDLDARLDVEGAEVDLVLGPLEERLGGAALAALAVDDPAAAGEAELGAVDVPHGLAVDLDDVGDPVGVLGRGTLGPQVVGLGQMGVGIDHPQPLQCQRHPCLPGLGLRLRLQCRLHLR